MQRNGTFWTLTLLVVAGLGFLIVDYFTPKNSAAQTTRLAQTQATVTHETTLHTKRSAKNLNLNKKNNIKPEIEDDVSTKSLSDKEKETTESQFQALRDEQRKQWQEIFGDDRDKMRSVMRAAIDNHPEFSEMFRRSREIRDNWATSSDSEKPALLAELTELRQKGMEIIKSELGKYTSTPPPAGTPDNTSTSSPQIPNENINPAEAETPNPPPVIM